MDKALLQIHIDHYLAWQAANPQLYAEESAERVERRQYFQSWSADRLRSISEFELSELLSKLWAMQIWGNKQYYIDTHILEKNGLQVVQQQLAELIWGSSPLGTRWDSFRSQLKGLGPAMMSELLCHVHPKECGLWNRRVRTGLEKLQVSGLPKYDSQINGSVYQALSSTLKQVSEALALRGIEENDLLHVDYFIYRELPPDGNLGPSPTGGTTVVPGPTPPTVFDHDDVKEKIAQIGDMLGFRTKTEVQIAAGSRVDTIWESAIGNLGRVIYVFEVQTGGNIDSLLINLQKALNNHAVQGIVAVSNAEQIEKIRNHSQGIGPLRERLRFWDYLEVLEAYDALQRSAEIINSLQLVPEGFGRLK